MEKNNLEEKVNNIKTNSEANENTEESKNRLSIKEKIKKFGIVEIIVFILYIIFIAIVAACHEFSQDETQSWLIARDLNLIDIIKQMKYEGHSFLWYYLIMPFAKLGFSIESQKIIVCLFAIATVYLILKKSPFNRLTKILLTFSSGMVYYYSAFARPYCMIPFLLACIAVIYKEKENHQYLYAILVGLLAHTHLVMFPTVFMLIITFWGKQLILKRKEKTKEEKKKLYKSLLLVIAIVSVYVIIAIISYFSCKIVRTYEGLGELLGAFPNLLSYTFKSTMVQFYGELYVPWYYKMLLLLIVILCVIGVKDSLKQGLTFWGQFIFTILVHTIIWFVLPTRVFIVIYTLMFWVWTDKDEQQKKE